MWPLPLRTRCPRGRARTPCARTHAARTPPISESRQPPQAPRLPRRFATSPADRKRKRASARPGEAPGRGRWAGRRGRGAVLPPAARRGLASPVSGEEAGAPVLCALRHRVPVAVPRLPRVLPRQRRSCRRRPRDGASIPRRALGSRLGEVRRGRGVGNGQSWRGPCRRGRRRPGGWKPKTGGWPGALPAQAGPTPCALVISSQALTEE